MDNKQKGRSVKQSAFDRFASWIFNCLSTGMFGSFFTSYDKRNRQYIDKMENMKGKESSGKHGKVRKRISHFIENSVLVNVFPKVPQFLLRVTTRDYGIILFVMGAVVSVLYALRRYMTLIDISLSALISGILICVCSVPLLFSAKSLSCDILSSKLVKKIVFDFCGARDDNCRIASEKPKFSFPNISFFIGLLLGVLSCFVSPPKILLAVFIAMLCYAVLTTPEMGVIILIFATPFANTTVLTVSVLYVSVCYIIKCMIGKRIFKFEYMDLWVVILMLTLLFSGFVSADMRFSLKEMLVDLVLVLSYFTVSNLIRSKEWYSRCMISIISSSFIVFIMALFQALIGNLSIVFPDASYFSTSGEFVNSSFASSLELGRYIVMVLPFILTYMITKRDTLPKFFGFILMVSSIGTLILTGSAEALIGCLAAVMLLLLIYHKKFIYLLMLILVALPILYFALPSAVTDAALAYLGFDSISSEVKLPTLQAAFQVMKKYPFGVGLGMFSKTSGMENAGSLYTQAGAETGFISLVLFIAFTVVFAKLIFSYCAKSKNRFRKISCSAGFASVTGILTAGIFGSVFSDKSIFLLFFIAIALSFAYVKIEREDETPKNTMVDITSASMDIVLSSDSAYEALPKRRYVHAPRMKPQKIRRENILKEFEANDIIRVIPDDESEEDKNE